MNARIHKSISLLLVLLLALGFFPTQPARAISAEKSATLPAGLYQAMLESTSQPLSGMSARAGGLDFTFSAGGLQAASLNWSISLSGFGRGNQVNTVGAAQPAQIEGRIQYERPELTEWYRDTAFGLEQGFTISQSPSGKGALVLQLSLSTDLEGMLDADGRGLSFRGADGQTLRYDHLLVWDANGAELEAQLLYMPGQVKIQVRDSGAAYPITIDPLIYLEQKNIALGGAANDSFGFSVALSGDTALVGTPYDDVGANADQGSAHVFVRSGTTWSQQAQITTPDGTASDYFGASVALSGDTALLGAPYDDVGANADQGSAYVFVRSGTTWSQQAQLTASDGAANDNFGFSVALSGDTALVGAYTDDVSANGNQGSAYVFARSGITWSEQAKLTASDGAANDLFGVSVALSGDTALVGAYLDDVGTNVDQGSAYVFIHSGTTWSQQQKLTAADGAANDYFGFSAALSGNTALVGAYSDDVGANADQGSAYVFVRSGTTWSEQAKLTASDGAANDYFGYSAALSGDTALLGAPYDDVGANGNQGSAYVFVRNGTSWTQQVKLTASDGAAFDLFGVSGALSGDTALVGAYLDDVGMNVDQGSVYFYQSYLTDADLSVSIATGTANPAKAGDTLLLTVSVLNYGPASAAAIALDVPLPAGLTYISHAVTNGVYDVSSGAWNIGIIPSNAKATLTIQATVDPISAASVTRTFTANIISLDTNNANNSASLSVTVRKQEQLLNCGFNTYSGTSKIPAGWSASQFASTDGKDITTANRKEGAAAVKIGGQSGKTKKLTQTLSLSGPSGDTFIFSYWVKGASLPAAGLCQAKVIFKSAGTTVLTKTLTCGSNGTFAYRKRSLSFSIPAPYDTVIVEFTSSKASGMLWFDGASLLR